MNGRQRRTTGFVPLVAVLIGAGGGVCPEPSWAGDSRISLGILGGMVQPDPSLADYRWDASSRGVWGLEAAAGTGRVDAGVRFSRWRTRQGTGIPGADLSPAVRVSRVELVVRARALTGAGFRFLGTGAVGRVHLGYSPDRLEIDASGGPVVVDLRPVDDWSAALGAAVERDLGRRWMLGAEIERDLFAIDTAHRAGNEIVEQRDTFADWNLRLRLSWVLRNN